MCPPHIRDAKRLYFLLQDRSDADNFDGTDLDIGLEEDMNEVDQVVTQNEQKENGDNEVANATDGNGGDATARRLFPAPVTAPRPLVRTPISSRRPNNNNSNNGGSDITAALVATLAASSRSEERERRERRRDRREDRRYRRLEQQDRQMNQFMMMRMLGMMNPAAAGATQPMFDNMIQQMRRSQNNSMDSSSNSESNDND